MNAVITELFRRMALSIACAGLDPDLSRIPCSIREGTASEEDCIWEFLTQFITRAAPHVCAFKPNKAFFDYLSGGKELLRSVIEFIHENHPGLPVLLDCKVGDTGNTMEAYRDTIFGDLKADGVMVNPYMGDEPVQIMAECHDKAVIVLVRTSNPGAAVTQDVHLASKRYYWEYILEQVIARWNTEGNLIPVLSSTAPDADYGVHRKSIPQNMPVFLAGVGEQGGDPTILRTLLNQENSGVLVNSSRGLLYPPFASESWQDDCERAVIAFREQLEILRR